MYSVNDQIEADRENIAAGGQSTYGNRGNDLSSYGQAPGGLPSYGQGNQGVGLPSYGQEAQGGGIPTYQGNSNSRLPSYGGQRVRDNVYGRDAKALELEETVVFTTPDPSPRMEELFVEDVLPTPETFKSKRNIKHLKRRTNKYSWASYP